MIRTWPLLFCAVTIPLSSAQPAPNPFAGRWDIDVTTANGSYPDWMEYVDRDGTPQIRIQPRGGAVRPATNARVESGKLYVTLSPAAANRPEVTWELTANGDQLTGVQRRGTVEEKITGVRAPALKRPEPKAWTKPEPLFNGKDLAGWTPLGGATNNHWVAENGELVNKERGANLRTDRTFQDSKLHLEVFCPEEHCNSGIYLRGRYEIQVGTEGGKEPSHEMGAVYGYFAAAKQMPMGIGEWQTFDITLVGRTVTVVRNGTVIHDRQELPGITGGALDSKEAEPGPFYLQGDHTGGLRYRNITVAVPQR